MAGQAPKTAVKIVFGAMTLGKEGAEQARVHSLDDAGAILDVFRKYGHTELDTARVYGGGSSEEYLGELKWQDRGIVMETKLSPRANIGLGEGVQTTHSPEHLRQGLKMSLEALKTDKVDMWYLHAPDRSTPYETTLREINNLHKEGKFRRFGISNYAAWEVAQMCEIADKNGWIKPTAYQGVYNAIQRAAELELFPCLRHYGIAFYAFNPVAGGFLTDRYHRDTTEVEAGSRFDPKRNQGQNYRGRYWKDEYFDGLDIIRDAIKKHDGLTEAEVALRWMMHHSKLNAKYEDAVIIGASSTKQLEENLTNFEKGPLPDDILKALDDAWAKVKAVCNPYFRAF
ncbi:Aldo/keto reductase [Microthyrium microscopicum]|uniref:Aldo/keto reductase n=1 Tax=Microthyrium microscopicum TaxID=703497 RepID=A0A6A6U8T1_9PEZI|nr:Aldo/keto reductase [Microthyrium microscopicum]